MTASQVSGGTGNDSILFKGDLSGGSVLGGASEDTLNFSAGVNNNAIISGDAGTDVLLFSSTITNAAIYGGAGKDSMVFKGAIGHSTIDFGAVAESATFSVAVSNSSILAGAGADTLVFSSSLISSSLLGQAGTDSISFSSASLAGGTQVEGGLLHDTISFTSSTLNGAKFDGGAVSDLFSGGFVVGSAGVSFYGGAGDDTFNFTGGISNSSGTAYFWNAGGGADSINLSNAGAVKTGLSFGVTAGAQSILNYGSVSDAFDASTSALFSVVVGAAHATNAFGNMATVAYSGTTGIFLTYQGNTGITIIGAAGIGTDFSGLFNAAGGTSAAFGIAQSFPSFS
jgi:hypothetical protein